MVYDRRQDLLPFAEEGGGDGEGRDDVEGILHAVRGDFEDGIGGGHDIWIEAEALVAEEKGAGEGRRDG